jgi:prolyl-tRNA editing enzyme YbaK/EbsC (Cys-tRNA(Pro) deacylase)
MTDHTDITPADATEAAVLARAQRAAVDSNTTVDVVVIDPDLADTAAFCAHYGYPLETSANCILVASRDDEPVVAANLVLATTDLDVNRRVRKLLGVRKLSFAPADLVTRLTGMQIGGVTPFGLPDDLPLHLDTRIRDCDAVIVGGGSRRLKLEVAPAALAALPNAVWVEDLARPARA